MTPAAKLAEALGVEELTAGYILETIRDSLQPDDVFDPLEIARGYYPPENPNAYKERAER